MNRVTRDATTALDVPRLRRFAILIDADNTLPRIAAGLFEEIARFGEPKVRRIYGDFSSSRMRSWSEILQRFAIDPYQQVAHTSGKNASDIALVGHRRDGPAAQRPVRRVLPGPLTATSPGWPRGCARKAPTSTASARRRRRRASGRHAAASSTPRT